MSDLLAGLRVLILEDEFLIAMDVEQLCREQGAADAGIMRAIGEMTPEEAVSRYDAAVVDLMLGGNSTLDFAARLAELGMPFVFASGYVDRDHIGARFPGVRIVDKPYAGEDLVQALAEASGRR